MEESKFGTLKNSSNAAIENLNTDGRIINS